MIICISGLSGSGKTAIAALLAKRLGIRHVSRSYKEFTDDRENLMRFVSRVKHSFDRKFDMEIIKEANKSDSVVSTWLGPWIIKNSSLNVWLSVSPETRARRKAKNLGISIAQARKYVKERDKVWPSHVKRTYGIDVINDHDVFDAELNGDRLTKEQLVSTIAMLSLEKAEKKFE